MEIEITQEKLAKALNAVSRVAVGNKVSLPILNNVLIRVDNKKATLTTTNLDMAVVDFIPVSKAEDGVITVPARLLAEFVSNLPRGEVVKLAVKDTKMIITAGRYSSTINGASADDFPELPEVDENKAVTFKMGVDEFKNGVNQVIVATSNDLTRPALTGVFFNTIDKVLAVAATDGYRLAEKKLIKDIESEVSAIVPTNSLQEVLRSISEDMEEIEISFSDDLVRFRLGEVEIISKLLDAKYPDYWKLFPKNSDIELELDKNELIRVTKLAALFARQANGSITCLTEETGKLLIKSVANELGENVSEIEAGATKAERINLSSRFLIDALNATEEDKVRFAFSNHVSPLVIKNGKSDDYTHIIMPLNS